MKDESIYRRCIAAFLGAGIAAVVAAFAVVSFLILGIGGGLMRVAVFCLFAGVFLSASSFAIGVAIDVAARMSDDERLK